MVKIFNKLKSVIASKAWRSSKCKILDCFTAFAMTFVFLLFSHSSSALSLTERLPGSADSPLDLLSEQPDKIFVPTSGDYADRYIITYSGASLILIDAETWALHETQPDDFPTTIKGVTMLGNGTSLVVALTDGDLGRIELDDETTFTNTIDTSTVDSTDSADLDSRVVDTSSLMTTAGISAIVANPSSDSETVYFINQTNSYYYEYNFNNAGTLTQISLSATNTDTSITTTYSPTDLAYANSNSDDAVVVTTSIGTLLIITPGGSTFTEAPVTVRTGDTLTPNFSRVVTTPDGDAAYVIDSTNDVIWVYSILNEAFEDQLSGGETIDPLDFSGVNSGLTDIAFLTDATDDSVTGYVSGDSGLSIFDATNPETSASTKIIDADVTTGEDDDPLTLSGTAGPLSASSSTNGTLFSANGDATMSVISDNPYVTISATSTDTLTEAASTFTVTFQSDEVGTYSVMANSDPNATTGTDLSSTGTVDTADSDVTTGTIDISELDRSVLAEGTNRIFVFVTDAEGHIGHDAIDITVDRPPEAISAGELSFGDGKIYANFAASVDNDIASYDLFAIPATDSTCPTSASSFTGDSAITASVSSTNCASGDTCTAELTGLTNGTEYCVAVRVVDESGQESDLASFSETATPEETVGPAGLLGETGCSLNTNSKTSSGNGLWLIAISLLALGYTRFMSSRRRPGSSPSNKSWIPASAGMTMFFLFSMTAAHAQSQTTNLSAGPEHFSFEARGTFWFPTRSEMKEFFPTCCNIMAEFEFGYLAKSKFNATVTVGAATKSGEEIGLASGVSSGDHFRLLMFPLRFDGIFRFNFLPNQFFVPFVRAGFDSVIFHETGDGDKAITGNKFGIHGGAGVAVQLNRFEDMGSSFEGEGINNVYFVVEGRYAIINGFSKTGLDFSGFYSSAGLLFTF